MIKNFFNKIMVALYRIPWVKNRWAQNFNAQESDTIPWTPLLKPLSNCKIALLTTGGVHLRNDAPFDMKDKYGDPTYRKIPSSVALKDITITHDYYNHHDADQDINLIFPIEILRDAQQKGLVGESAEFFYSFMGHIDKHLIKTLMEKTAKEVAHLLKKEKVDIAFIVPA
jgi:D-proline reductase (dithiol) PrdB